MEKRLIEQLYHNYHRELFLYLYSLCNNRDLADDILQETFLKAMLALDGNHQNMRAWLYMVARNLYYNYSKKEHRNISIDEAWDGEPADREAQVIDKYINSEKLKVMYKALEKLDTNKREILLMQYFGELSQKEIAKMLNLTPENIRVLAYRGKKEMKKYLEAEGYEI